MSPLAQLIGTHAVGLDGPRAFNPLLGLIGPAPVVLLGAATGGSHELFATRAIITQELITQKGFNLLAIEADWPDARRLNQFVRGISADPDAPSALACFGHFPTWPWRNRDHAQFLDWLRTHNQSLPEPQQVQILGLDLLDRSATLAAVVRALHQSDLAAEHWAQTRFAAFDHAAEVPHPYDPGSLELGQTQINAIVGQLIDQHRRHRETLLAGPAPPGMLDQFYLEQSQRMTRSAELYYRSLFEERTPSANLHEEHLAGTLAALTGFHRQHGQLAKVVVWAHNVHVGDSRATQLGAAGEWSMGQLVRQLYGDKVVLIGFTTHHGTVTAAANWDGAAQQMALRPALLGSYESLFHETGRDRFLLCLEPEADLTDALYRPRLQRAIGAVYLVQTERLSHYFQARLPAQFNAVLHFDQTQALEPLEHTADWDRPTTAERYPRAA